MEQAGMADGDLRCMESSTASKVAWLRSLGHGCLNKGAGDKFKAYIHIRDLSTKLIKTLGCTKISQFGHPPNFGSSSDKHQYSEEQEAVEVPHLSLVILEDFSKPPAVEEEITPLLFTSVEFFDYLYSDNWGGEISLRLVSGDLVDVLITAMYSLQRAQLLNGRVISANLNSRVKSSLAEKVASSKDNLSSMLPMESVKGENKTSSKAYSPRSEFVYEKMNVEIIIYEKLESSNVPYIVRDTDTITDSSASVHDHREVLHVPYALKQHIINYVRLPAYEDISQHKIIEQLTAELEDPKNVENVAKDQPEKASSSVSDKVEVIADDPFLIPERLVVKGSRMESKGFTVLSKKTSSVPKRTSSANKESTGSVRKSSTVNLETTYEVTTKDNLSRETVANRASQIESSVLLSNSSSDGSFTVVRSPTQIMSETEEEHLFKRLDLTRSELYVTNLYCPQISNNMSAKKKLKLNQQVRLKDRREKEQNIYQKLQEKVSFDLHDRFKSLASKKDISSKKGASPLETKVSWLKSPKSSTVPIWNGYLQEQEEIEMDSALINPLEKGIIDRMQYTELRSVEKKKESTFENKSKPTKNKNRNNPHREMKSSHNSNSNSQLRQRSLCSINSLSRQRSLCSINSKTSNSNSMKKAAPKCADTEGLIQKLKCPPIIKENFKRVGVTENKDTCSIMLPALEARNNAAIKTPHIIKDKRNEISQKTFTNVSQNSNKVGKFTLGNEANVGVKVDNFKFKKQLHASHDKQEVHEEINSYSGCNNKCNSNIRLISNFNRSQTSSTLLEENEDDKEETVIAEEDLAIPSQQSSDALAPTVNSDSEPSEKKKPASDSLCEQLKPYSCECSSGGCIDMIGSIATNEGCSNMTEYPPYLGRLRRDFTFLNCSDYKPKKTLSPQKTRFSLPEITNQFVCDTILEMLDTVMIRKEIVTSTLGYTSVTFTFTRPSEA